MNRGFLKGFTLAELLVATLVLSIMLVVMAPVMTKKAKARVEQKVEIVQAQQETLPVGVIVLWYGPNIPEGWVECSGQIMSDAQLQELRNTIAISDYIPNLNQILSTADTNLKWIIKSK